MSNTITFENNRVTVTQASKWLGVSRETLYNWIRNGRISYIVEEDGTPTRYLSAVELDHVRHERIVAKGQEMSVLMAVPRLA